MRKNKVDGQDITNVRTRKSWHDSDCVIVEVGAPFCPTFKRFLLPASTILQMVNEFEFKKTKKKTWTWLEEAELKQ